MKTYDKMFDCKIFTPAARFRDGNSGFGQGAALPLPDNVRRRQRQQEKHGHVHGYVMEL